ncbi:MAG: FAD-dependent oxidoreductase [Simkaniaceae bacterium]|nr:FAD-dependent oxidoreductase [Simkaniaceae bacterium]
MAASSFIRSVEPLLVQGVEAIGTFISRDFCAIGSGPAGVASAIESSRLGKRAIVIDRFESFGGASLHSGTIPSKTLWSLAQRTTEIPNFALLREGLIKVIKDQKNATMEDLIRNHVCYLNGLAEFVDPHTVAVFSETGSKIATVVADHFIIATGSMPRQPEGLAHFSSRIVNSTELLMMDEIPNQFIVMGGGVIGSEYATILHRLGSRVTIVDSNERMLKFLDPAISEKLRQILMESGRFSYIPNVKDPIMHLEDDVVRLSFDDRTIEGDYLLHALGRVANVKMLNLDAIGVELTHRGHIAVNELFQTSVPHIYAGGDVKGSPGLASTAWREGGIIAHLAHGRRTEMFPEIFPTGIYTIPEIGCCGKTEMELKEKNIEYAVGVAEFKSTSRGIIENEDGMVKMLFDPDSGTVYGAHMIGKGAAGMIHYPNAVMRYGGKISDFYTSVSNYPTIEGELLRNAALNGVHDTRH